MRKQALEAAARGSVTLEISGEEKGAAPKFRQQGDLSLYTIVSLC
jgi:hypothetical protein